jgi:hypothetical protein
MYWLCSVQFAGRTSSANESLAAPKSLFWLAAVPQCFSFQYLFVVALRLLWFQFRVTRKYNFDSGDPTCVQSLFAQPVRYAKALG